MNLAFGSMRFLTSLILVATTACGAPLFGGGPTISPLLSARFLTVHLFTTDAADDHERLRLPQLRDAIAGALPNAWSAATGGRGKLALRTDADIDVELKGTSGTSALTQHKRGGKVVYRTIRVHTIENGRRLGLSELMSTTLHELGHIWCCYGPGATGGHWDAGSSNFSPVGLMIAPMYCQRASGDDFTCPNIFSERELTEMGLIGR